MTRTLSSLLTTTFALAFAMPALARPASGADVPSCGDEKKEEKKPPSAAPQCDGDGKDEKTKDEKKDPARL
jgi:hypothetical protein